MPITEDLIKTQSVSEDGLYTVEINKKALNETDGNNPAESLNRAIDRFYELLKTKPKAKTTLTKAHH